MTSSAPPDESNFVDVEDGFEDEFRGEYSPESAASAPPQESLDFGNFEHSSASLNNGKMGDTIAPSGSPPPGYAESFAYPPLGGSGSDPAASPPPSATGAASGKARFWELQFYQPLFDVTTRQVLLRLLRSLMCWSPKFLENLDGTPDFYGPFWVCTTVVIMMAVTGNLASYVSSWVHSTVWEYDITLVSVGAGVVYLYILLVPLLLWLLLNWWNVALTWPQLLCLYGYSLFVYIPTSVLCIIPYSWVKYVALLAASAVSTLFLLANLFGPLRSEFRKGLLTLLGVAVLHAGLGISFLLYVFAFGPN